MHDVKTYVNVELVPMSRVTTGYHVIEPFGIVHVFEVSRTDPNGHTTTGETTIRYTSVAGVKHVETRADCSNAMFMRVVLP